MTLQEMKESLNSAGLSEESLQLINQIIDAGIAAGGVLSSKDMDTISAIVGLEMEAIKIEADAVEEISSATEMYTKDMYAAFNTAEKELDSLDLQLTQQLNEVLSPFVQAVH